ncbi:hypothetical protein LCGC14_1098870 [marine sediment metagenome]|uniref:ERCC4 domain-containing protein n=1 Tax=marine sediment metagenome TaxID=412755 RepID=A0A0F9MEL0_9ZZZZ
MTAGFALDSRIGSKHLVTSLKALGLPVSLELLDFGDAAFLGNGPTGPVMVGIELKNLNDLLSSARSGRLVGRQLPGMLDDYELCWLFVEGEYRPNPETGRLQVKRRKWVDLHEGHRGWMYREVDSFLTTLEVILGVRIQQTTSSGHTAMCMANLYRWWQKDWADHHAHEAYDESRRPGQLVSMTAPTLCHEVAIKLPGVGYRKAQRVAKTFGTTRKMVNAARKDWLAIEGIGRVIAERIDKELGEP